jgi:hypothetical protein
MSRKPKRKSHEKKRAKVHSRQQEENDLVAEMVAELGCSTATAREMLAQCNCRLDEIEIDLSFTDVARHLWQGRPGCGEELTFLIDELTAEQQRHATVMKALGARLQSVVDANDHEHREINGAEVEYIRRSLVAPPEDRPEPVVDAASLISGRW